MEFLKKNYIKMIIAAITLIGAIFIVVLLAQYKASYHGLGDTMGAEDSKNANSVLIGYITALIFFITLTTIVILTMFDNIKKYTKWITLSLGAVCTILMIVAIILAIGSDTSELLRSYMKVPAMKDIAQYSFFTRVVELVTQLVIFGLLPLAFGLKKVLTKAK